MVVKIFTESATQKERDGITNQLPAMAKLAQHGPHPHCSNLISSFTIPPKGGTKHHICMLTPVYGGDVRMINDQLKPPVYSLKLTKHILLHLLRGLSHAHKCGIVHTDVRLSNIFFDSPMSTQDIHKWIKSDPVRPSPWTFAPWDSSSRQVSAPAAASHGGTSQAKFCSCWLWVRSVIIFDIMDASLNKSTSPCYWRARNQQDITCQPCILCARNFFGWSLGWEARYMGIWVSCMSFSSDIADYSHFERSLYSYTEWLPDRTFLLIEKMIYTVN